MIAQKIKSTIKQFAQKKYDYELAVPLEHPNNESFGDYATNLALSLYSEKEEIRKEYSSPRALAENLVKELRQKFEQKDLAGQIDEITIAGPGFINLSLSQSFFEQSLSHILQDADYGQTDWGQGQIWEIEHTSPNPNKAMHLGHLRNNVTGMAISNLWEAIGLEVIRDAVDNNRGIAIARLMWGYLKFAHQGREMKTDLDYWYRHQDEWLTPAQAGQRPDRFVDELYVKASQDFKQSPEVEQRVRQMVVDWEANHEPTRALWKKVMDYSHQGQEMTLKRLGNHWDKVWHEHEHYQQGKDLVEQGLAQGIFQKLDDGAILTDLAKYDLPDTILIKSDGTSLYITQDLALTKHKIEQFNADKLHWVIGPEQSLALKQMFAVCEQLGFVKKENLTHIDYGYMSIKGQGKMSSRAGNVVYIDDLIDAAKEKVLEVMKKEGLNPDEVDNLAEKVAVGAVKYSILKVGRKTDTAFDFETALRLDGNSGPYLQYTHARACSVLAKAEQDSIDMADFNLEQLSLNVEEQALVRYLYRFPETVLQAALEYEPSQVATYLYQLGQRFNRFYNKHQILNNGQDKTELRLALTKAVSRILNNGLNMLGIAAPERM